MKIYVSTGGARDRTALEITQEFLRHGLDEVELSGGLPDDSQLLGLKGLTSKASLQVHNYFPPPLEPFVLNVASKNSEIASKSMAHVRKAIDWSLKLDRPVYSFHAGFLLDPLPFQLGKKISAMPLQCREETFEIFVDRVKMLARESAAFGVTLLIENNVLSPRNLSNFGANPFLLADTHECKRFMELMPPNVGLLIDVAHLKISAKSLGFDPASMLLDCGQWTRGYHLSDNDGMADTNEPLSVDSWFWPYLKPDVNFHVLEIYNVSPEALVEQRSLAMKMVGDNQ